MSARDDIPAAGLLPCPFCGGSARIRRDTMSWVVATCGGCKSEGRRVWNGGPHPTDEELDSAKVEAAAVWNRRFSRPAPHEADRDRETTRWFAAWLPNYLLSHDEQIAQLTDEEDKADERADSAKEIIAELERIYVPRSGADRDRAAEEERIREDERRKHEAAVLAPYKADLEELSDDDLQRELQLVQNTLDEEEPWRDALSVEIDRRAALRSSPPPNSNTGE